METEPTLPHPPRRQEHLDASEEIREVAPDVLWMQLPIALPGLAHVNCYAILDGDGVTLVDPGLPGKPSWRALQDRLRRAEIPTEKVHTVVVTHSHPDHFGNAGKLAEDVGAAILTHSAFQLMHKPFHVCTMDDCDNVDHAHPDHGQEPLPEGDQALKFGMKTPWGSKFYMGSQDMADRLKATDGKPNQGTEFLSNFGWPFPKPTKRVRNATMITLGRRDWQAVHTPGHTLDHLCLYDETTGTLITGDHILPTITPHISGIGSGRDALGSFFASLDHCASLPGLRQALPAHGLIFDDVPGRIEAIKEHHAERLRVLARVAQANGPQTVEEFSHYLFRKERWGSMAESETYAHLVHLVENGEAVRTIDAEGTMSFDIASAGSSASD